MISPLLITKISSLIANASSWSCVTKINVIPRRCCNSRSSYCMSVRSFKSNADNGSSSSSTSGSLTSARAIATRCCCPPDICEISRFSYPDNCTIFKASATFSLMMFSGVFFKRNPNAIFSNTFICGNNA